MEPDLGHDKVLTTFLSYGQVESPRQGEIIRSLSKPTPPEQYKTEEIVLAIVRAMRNAGNGTDELTP